MFAAVYTMRVETMKYALAVTLVVCCFLPNSALSDMSISSYQENIKVSSKRDVTYFYLEAVGTGITWTNSVLVSKMGYSLFCMPKRIPLKGEVAASILNRYLSSSQGRQLKKNDSVSLALLVALMYRFPCS